MASEKEQQSVDYSIEQSDLGEPDSQDAMEMRLMGKKQQFRRNFEYWSTLAFSCCTMITWSGQLFTFLAGLENGGPEGVVISLFVTWTAMAAIIASLAELMSMWPTSGGQYHWTYTLSPPKMAPFLSYMCGWFCVLAWLALVASAVFLGGTFLQGIIALNNATYDPKPYQGLLLGYSILSICVIGNTAFAKWLHKIEWVLLFLYIGGFFVVLITTTVLSPHKASAHEVFGVFYNGGHWSSNGVSWFVGLQGIVFAWLGADGAIHMSEEVRDASRVLPRSLMASVAINGIMSIAILFAVLFCGGNLVQAAKSGTYPIQAIFTFATGSVAGATGLSVILLLTGVFATFCGVAAASRELWAFSRDHGLPASNWVKVVHEGTKVPLRAIFITAMFAILLNLIQLGSAVALNAVVSLTVSAYNASYSLPLSLILYRRIKANLGRGKELPWGPWTLGKWTGVLINIYALVWVILIVVWSFFPPVVNPTPTTMNWSSTVFGGVVILALGFWFLDGRRRYHGPVRDAAGGAIEPVVGWLRA